MQNSRRLSFVFSVLGLILSTTLFAAENHDGHNHAAGAHPVDGNYVEGVHYQRLQIPIRTNNKDQIEVAEYFSYGCPHCYQLEPYIVAWKRKLADDVKFVRTPAVWGAAYKVYARTYYTAKALKMVDKIHNPLFVAIHQQRKPLHTPELMARWFESQGIAAKDFAKTYNSFGVNASLQKADARGRAYRSSSVPALIINGKFRVDGSMAGGNANMLKVADFLIEQERKALSNKAS